MPKDLSEPVRQTILDAPKGNDRTSESQTILDRDSEPPFRAITDQLSVPLEDVARAIGKTYATVAAYRHGKREPPPEVWRRLARFIRSHGSKLTERVAEQAEALALDRTT
jgi:hypothetical protein